MIKQTVKSVDRYVFNGKILFLYKKKYSKKNETIASRRIFFEKKISSLWQMQDEVSVESYILEAAENGCMSTWIVNFYIKNFILLGKAAQWDKIRNSKLIRFDHLSLLESAYSRSIGDVYKALEKLEFETDSKVVNFQRVNYERALLHRLRNDKLKVKKGINFIEQEESAVLIYFAWHTAGSAQNEGDSVSVKKALSRVFSDIEKVKSSKKLLKKYWRQVVEVQIKVFDIEGALKTARLARKLNILKTCKEEDKIIKILEKVSPIKSLVYRSREKVLEDAGLFSCFSEDKKNVPVVVFHSAAVAVNKIDYQGFREDIIFAYSSIIESLESIGVNYEVDVKFLTHGRMHLSSPYFSYHTYSVGEDLGIHFKETDRPSLFSFDSKGYAGWSNLSSFSIKDDIFLKVDNKEAEVFFSKDQNDFIQKKTSKYLQANWVGALPEKYIFVALQIMGDAVQQLAFRSPYEMLSEVTAVAKSNNIGVVVKRHPYCKSPEIANFLRKGEENGDLIVVNGNIHELIEKSVAVCVVNSGVGAEAVIYEKPVYVFGKCDYMSACFICKYAGDFSAQFVDGRMPLTPNQLKKFWFVYRNEYSFNFNSPLLARNKISKLVVSHLDKAK